MKLTSKKDYIQYIRSLGFSQNETIATLDSLLYAEKIGRKTHGLIRIHSGFIEKLITKRLVFPNQEPKINKIQDGYYLVDGNYALGYYGIKTIIDRILSNNKSMCTFVNVKNLYPTNCLSEYMLRLTNGGYIGYVTSKTPSRVLGALELSEQIEEVSDIFGTNAYCWGWPSIKEPIIFDTTMAATTNGQTLLLSQGEGNFESSSYLTETLKIPKCKEDLFDKNNNFNANILPFGGKRMFKGMGNLLPAEMFNLLQDENSNGLSTTIIIIAPPEISKFNARSNQFRKAYNSSIVFTDKNVQIRLPFQGKLSKIEENHEEEKIFELYKDKEYPLYSSKFKFCESLSIDEKCCIKSLKEKILNKIIKYVQDYFIFKGINIEIEQLERVKISGDQVDFFNEWCNEGYELEESPDLLKLHKWCLQQLNPNCNEDILDIGSGNGSICSNIENWNANWTFLDVSEQMIKEHESRLKELKVSRNVNYIVNDFLKTPLDVKYDKIFSILCLHHYDINDKPKVVVKISDLMKSGGYFVLGETFLDTNNLENKNSILHISELYLNKIINNINNKLFKHALKDIEILKRILHSKGEYMISLPHWADLFVKHGDFSIVKSSMTSPEISYGGILFKKN